MPLSKFEQLCTNLMKSLEESDKLNDFCNFLMRGGSPEVLFCYVWGLEEFHDNLVVDLVPSSKSEVQAEMFRSMGNKFYNEKSYARALELYNMCLMTAEHPCGTSPTEECTVKQSVEVEYNSLANGYTDRSELLFQMKQYERTILDIERAIYLGCTKESHPKLFQRKQECQHALEELKKYSIDDPESSDFHSTKESQYLQKKDTIQDSQKPCSSGPIFSMTDDDLIFAYNTPDPPKLKEANSNIPSFSSSLKVEYTPEQGRFVVADKDIDPGEVILVEKSYVCLPNPDPNNLRSRCCICLVRTHVPIPCPTCHTVVFCSETCRDESLTHKVECCILPTCIALGIDKHAVQALRVLVQTSFQKLKAQMSYLIDEKNNKTPSEYGFNKDGIYDSTDYRPMYHLEGNMKKRNASDLFYKSVKAFLLANMLYETGKFFKGDSGEALFLPSERDMTLVGTSLLNHLMSLPQNSYAITEFQVNMKNHRYDAQQRNVAVGVFSAASLMNHSCNASTTRTNYGNVMALYARQFIPVGSEVSINYGYSYHQDSLEDRKSHLLSDYKFDCKCDACLKDWPILKDFPPNSKIKAVEPKKKKKLEKELKASINKYRKAFIEFDEQNQENINLDTSHLQAVMSNTITFMDKFCELPNRDYFNSQKILTHCIEKKASYYYFRK